MKRALPVLVILVGCGGIAVYAPWPWNVIDGALLSALIYAALTVPPSPPPPRPGGPSLAT